MKLTDIAYNISNIKVFEFDRDNSSAFIYNFEKDLADNEIVIVKMPRVTANKRGVNDIGWLSDGDVTLYGTLAKDPRNKKALYQEIKENDDVNKVTSAVAVVNNGVACRIEMRAILN